MGNQKLENKNICLLGNYFSLRGLKSIRKDIVTAGGILIKAPRYADIIFIGTRLERKHCKLLQGIKSNVEVYFEFELLKIVGREELLPKTQGIFEGVAYRIYDMVRELIYHENIDIHQFKMLPFKQDNSKDTDTNKLSEWKDKAGISDSMLSFFGNIDSLNLLWSFKDNPNQNSFYRSDVLKQKDSGWYVNDLEYDGSIRIMPLDIMFGSYAKYNWADLHPVTGEQLNVYLNQLTGEPLEADLKMLDYFSERNMMAIQCLPKKEDAILLFGDNNGGAFDSYIPTTFQSYIEMILNTYGSVNARRQFYSNGFQKNDKYKLLEKPKSYWERRKRFSLNQNKFI
ncbi:hypothetical protein [Flavivirga eckloniae]|uniref:Uncharacterized protein n=1 Tax=Flavivirga eckloniae TaxID=1803846 RepID=A0A2K9PU95_9FLAO|nr:hypothetical protein [Flavivirga eckloniae]AUP80645.1 hypothetical protein C1H87_18775 [Flavivirga eckloniae]